MVDNKKPKTTQEILDAITDERAQKIGYPNADVYRLEQKMVKLGYKLRDGDESVRDEYYAALDELFAQGWNALKLDGQQEIMLGDELSLEIYARHEALQAKILKS